MLGTIAGTMGAFVLGGSVAAATIVGVVSAQTRATGPSPADVTKPVAEQQITYGSTE